MLFVLKIIERRIQEHPGTDAKLQAKPIIEINNIRKPN